MWVRARATAVATAAVLAVVAPPPATAATPPLCLSFSVSPAYARDRTIYCVRRINSQEPLVLAVTTDGGRTWRTPAMSGLTRSPDPSGYTIAIVLSPAYGSDRALFALTGGGTYVSTDRGESFAPVDPYTRSGATPDNPAVFLGRPSVLSGIGGDARPRLHLAYASTRAPVVVDVAERTVRPALGVPGRGAQRFLVPAGAEAPTGALAVVTEPGPDGDRVTVYRCDAQLTCAERLFAFPPGHYLGHDEWVRRLPDGSLVAMLREGNAGDSVWRSTDGGRSFAVWRGLTRALGPILATGDSFTAGIASNPALPRLLYARVEWRSGTGRWTAAMPPAYQIFRSDDGGTSWRRVAYGLDRRQPGRRGNIPWHGVTPNGELALTPDGRLLAGGLTDDLATTFCSLDGGRRWTVGCPR